MSLCKVKKKVNIFKKLKTPMNKFPFCHYTCSYFPLGVLSSPALFPSPSSPLSVVFVVIIVPEEDMDKWKLSSDIVVRSSCCIGDYILLVLFNSHQRAITSHCFLILLLLPFFPNSIFAKVGAFQLRSSKVTFR